MKQLDLRARKNISVNDDAMQAKRAGTASLVLPPMPIQGTSYIKDRFASAMNPGGSLCFSFKVSGDGGSIIFVVGVALLCSGQ